MKTFVVLFSLCFIGMVFLTVSFTSCHKYKKAEDFPVPPAMRAAMKHNGMKHKTSLNVFSKTAGKLFSRDTLNTWIANYKQSFKTSFSSCSFNSSTIKNLCDDPNAAGVMFYNVNIDDKYGLVAIGVNTVGQLMNADSVISSVGYIEWDKAMEIVSDYQATHANGLWGEFFGSITLNNFITLQNVQNIVIQMGTNSNGPRMILTNASSTTDPGTVDGTPCPPNCHN